MYKRLKRAVTRSVREVSEVFVSSSAPPSLSETLSPPAAGTGASLPPTPRTWVIVDGAGPTGDTIDAAEAEAQQREVEAEAEAEALDAARAADDALVHAEAEVRLAEIDMFAAEAALELAELGSESERASDVEVPSSDEDDVATNSANDPTPAITTAPAPAHPHYRAYDRAPGQTNSEKRLLETPVAVAMLAGSACVIAVFTFLRLKEDRGSGHREGLRQTITLGLPAATALAWLLGGSSAAPQERVDPRRANEGGH